jgi:hypothetical protein
MMRRGAVSATSAPRSPRGSAVIADILFKITIDDIEGGNCGK